METHPFNKNFTENYNEDSGEGYLLEVGVQYSKKVHDSHIDLPFLPENIKN